METPSIAHESFAWEYDVFLSFRGEDTRKTFTDHLYFALHQAGIRTFRDEEKLRKGEHLAPELMRAIQTSRIALIVFSKDYASSTWCLDELVEIVKLKEKGKLRVFPVFYHVDPSEVRKQNGIYGMALAKNKERFHGNDKVQKWRDALTKVANMSGWDLQGIANGYESKFIKFIIKEVRWIVSRVPIFVVKHGVGLDSRVERVVQLVLGESNDGVRMVGIYGMGGIGKTTLAKAVYNRFIEYFENSCFLEIESSISGQEDNGINLKKVDQQIKKVQKRLFQKLLDEKINIGSIDEVIMLIKRRLRAKKCLIVIDNLEHRNQFNKLCGGRDWFGEGSRLILTTREAHVLKELKEDERYEVKALVHEESLELFSLHAFREPTLPKEDYDEVLDNIVTYCAGLPLALEVLGAYLSDKSREEWISTFEKLKEIPNNDVQAKLKISYDGLPDDRTKSAFLDLVCFPNNYRDKETIDCMVNFSNIEIRNLTDRCLIKKDSLIIMHDLIRKMGREIICLESPNNPSERSRLWCPNDIHDVLIGQKGTKKIEVILFDESPMKNVKYSTKAFKNMENLRFLRIKGEYVHLDGKFKHLSKELKCLKWNYCPLKYIDVLSNPSFGKLVKLEMMGSNIKEFRAPSKYFSCMESLDLSMSKHLTKTPDFHGAQNLRMLSFRGCNSLVNVHPSIGELGRLKSLNFGFCPKLNELPNNLCQLFNLESINLESCKKLEVLPKLPHSVKFELQLSNCENLKLIQEFPPNLMFIFLNNCKNLEKLPQLPLYLDKIILSGCKKLKMVPKLPRALGTLEAKNCVSMKKALNLSNCTRLFRLDLSGCRKLEKIQGWENLLSLWRLEVGGVPHIDFSKSVKVALIGLKLHSNLRCTLTCNEIPSWIKCKEEGSSISIQWPLCNSENYTLGFAGIIFWVVFKAHALPLLHLHDSVIVQINGFNADTWVYGIQLEEVSFLHFSSRYWLNLVGLCKVIKAGEVMKVTVRSKSVEAASMVKKLGVAALYRDTDGFVQFVPITKVGLNTKKRKRNSMTRVGLYNFITKVGLNTKKR